MPFECPSRLIHVSVGYATTTDYYLFHISENGEVADTCHQTLEEAFDQAER